jgi:hypothetical protein
VSAADLGDESRHCVECSRYVGALEVAKYLNDDTVEDQVDVICNACYGGVLRRNDQDLAAMTANQVATLLRTWASGSRSAVAATELLIATGQVARSVQCGLVTLEMDAGETYAYIDYDVAEATGPGSWRYAAGVYSSGEQAILALVASLARGELSRTLWSLDSHNRTAFIAAIEAGEEA